MASELMRCCAKAIPSNEVVIIYEATDGKRHIGGLMHCGRHLCPLCHPFRAGERRERQLTLADANWLAGDHFLFTPSARHQRSERWEDQKAVFKLVSSKIQRLRMWQQIVIGFIRTDETTWNENSGHHFHQHFLLTLRSGADQIAFSRWLETTWTRLLENLGREGNWEAVHRGWWKPLPTEQDLRAVIGYLSKGPQAWDWPPAVFAEVWAVSKGHRWSGAGGIWKAGPVAAKAQETASVAGDRELSTFAWILRSDWNRLRMADRAEIQLVAASRRMGPAQFLVWLGERTSALGGILHPGAPPEEGMVAASSALSG